MGFVQPTRIQFKAPQAGSCTLPDLVVGVFPNFKSKGGGQRHHGPSATREEHIAPRQVEVLLPLGRARL
jgi:hypothetical protein